MRLRAPFSVVLLVCSLCFNAAAVTVAPATATVPIELSNNHVMVPVVVNGEARSFVLDTGAANSLIDLGRARSAGLALGNAFSANGAGAGSTAGALLKEPLTLRVAASPQSINASVRAALDFSDLSNHAGRDFDGLLGADFIRRFVVEIDYEHRRLRLYDADAFSYRGSGTTVPFTFNSAGFPVVRATLHLPGDDALDVSAVLDVGASGALVVNSPVVTAHDLADRLQVTAPMPIGRGVGGQSEGWLARLPGLSIGTARLDRLVAALAGPASGGAMSTTRLYDVNVGGGFMRHFTMYFDYQRSRVTFEPNGHAADPFEADMTGLILTTAGAGHERVMVEQVLPGSAAAEAGVTAGDRLLTIDGMDAAVVTLDGLRERFRVNGQRMTLTIERDGRTLTVALTTRRIV